MDDGLRMVRAGVCSAWPLPGDPTCAGVARRMFRRAAGEVALDPVAIDDGELMVSELAAEQAVQAYEAQAGAARTPLSPDAARHRVASRA